jgi:protein gp37
MSANSAIEWTDHTWSPWWGCDVGCNYCYAARLATRFGCDCFGSDKRPRMMSEAHWADPLRWDATAAKEGRRYRVFPSMCDPFDGRDELISTRERFWALIESTPHLDWLLLTKRPKQIYETVPGLWYDESPPNVWLGVTATTQRDADRVLPELLRNWNHGRTFMSAEPLLGPIDLRRADPNVPDWVIAGGMSGPGAVPCHPDWVRSLRDQCVKAFIPFFFKQWGGRSPKANGSTLDGREWKQLPKALRGEA